jgi:hypothetical protein
MHWMLRMTPVANVLLATMAGCGSDGGAKQADAGGQPDGPTGFVADDGGEIDGAAVLDGPSGTGGIDGLSIDAMAWPNVGVCGERGQATADLAKYDGYEETVIFSEEGLGSEACVVRFDVVRAGNAPHASGCMETLAKACEWTHLVEFRNPRVLTDVDGVCGKSDLGLTPDAIAKREGSRIEIGFAKQFAGAHGSVRMKYFEAQGAWDVDGNATWDATAGTFTYRYQNGYCNYGP